MTKVFQNRKFTRFISFLLLFVLVVMLFVSPVLLPKVYAEPITITVAAVAGLVALLGLIGITFATTDAAKEAAQMVSAYDDLWEDINSIRIPPDGPGNGLGISSATSALTATILYRLYQIFKQDNKGSFDVPDATSNVFQNVPFLIDPYSISSAEFAWNYASYPLGTSVNFNVNGVPYSYRLRYTEQSPSNKYIEVIFTKNGVDYPALFGYGFSMIHIFTTNEEMIDSRMGFFQYTKNSVPYLFPFFVSKFRNSSGVIQYQYSSMMPEYTNHCVPLITDETSPLLKSVPYKISDRFRMKNIIDAINRLVEVAPVTVPTIDIETAIENDDDTGVDKNQDYFVDLLPGLKDLLDQKRIDDIELDPDLPYKPAIIDIPDITSIWDYVEDFAEDALIWVKLWFSGFILLPDPLKGTLWALLVISVFTGLLGVFLK